MGQITMWITRIVMLGLWATATPSLAEEPVGQTDHQPGDGRPVSFEDFKSRLSYWHYGGFVDLGSSLDFSFPDNHQFRDGSTTALVNEPALNMGGVYIRKDAQTSHAGAWSFWARQAKTARILGSE